MLEELKSKNKLVGFKQSLKAVEGGHVKKAFLAREAQDKVRIPVEQSCAQGGIEIEYVDTLKELGAACDINIGAAVAVLLK